MPSGIANESVVWSQMQADAPEVNPLLQVTAHPDLSEKWKVA